jgi:hypothetical protein
MEEKESLSSPPHTRQTHHLARSHRQLDLPRNRFRKLTLYRLTNDIFYIVTIHRDNIVTFVVLFNDKIAFRVFFSAPNSLGPSDPRRFRPPL